MFSFPSYCHSVIYRVVSIVSSGCNVSFVFLYIVFVSLYRCVNAVSNAGKSSSSLFSRNVSSRLWDVRLLRVVYSFAISAMLFLLQHLPKLFCFFGIQFFNYHCNLSAEVLVEFSFVTIVAERTSSFWRVNKFDR